MQRKPLKKIKNGSFDSWERGRVTAGNKGSREVEDENPGHSHDKLTAFISTAVGQIFTSAGSQRNQLDALQQQ